VDVIVGRSWLELPHVNFYKLRDQVIIETFNSIDPSVVPGTATVETSEIRTALIDADQPFPSPIEQSDINLGAQISESERKELLQLINQYRDVFAKSLTDIGCTPLLEMDITEVTGSAPVRQKPYRTSPSDRRAIAEILNNWRSAGIISDSTSPYASPVLLVDKGSGKKRLCVDYRRLNQQTQDQHYPIPAGRRPFEVVHVDHVGPFETSAAGNRYLFVLVDNLTKFTHLYPCRSYRYSKCSEPFRQVLRNEGYAGPYYLRPRHMFYR